MVSLSVEKIGRTRREDLSSAHCNRNRSARGASTTIALNRESAGSSPEVVLELERLHETVGRSIKLHKYTPGGDLPTKKGALDWTLGELAVEYGKSSGYDYALFLYATDSFSSGGRKALQAMAFLGCAVGVCLLPPGGSQQAFVSLVDLRSGKVVWFNNLFSEVGDIRTEEGADELVHRLLDSMSSADANKKRAKKG